MVASQLKEGDDYGGLKPVIGIHLMDFELFDQDQAHWCFELRDRHHPHVALDHALQLHLIELPKADRQRHKAQRDALAAWIAYFEHWREESIMSDIHHTPVRQAMDRLKHLSADEEAQRLAFVRERALRDELSELNAARKEGRQEGREEGRHEGRAAVLARQMGLKFGELPAWVEQRLDEADATELDLWAERILSAVKIEEVFQ